MQATCSSEAWSSLLQNLWNLCNHLYVKYFVLLWYNEVWLGAKLRIVFAAESLHSMGATGKMMPDVESMLRWVGMGARSLTGLAVSLRVLTSTIGDSCQNFLQGCGKCSGFLSWPVYVKRLSQWWKVWKQLAWGSWSIQKHHKAH